MCWNRIIEDEQLNLKRESVERELLLSGHEELPAEIVEMAQIVPELVEVSA